MADDDRAERPMGSGGTSGTGSARPAGGSTSRDDLSEPKFSWQGAPGYSSFDPQRFPPHAPMPGAPPYPAAPEHERPPISAGRRREALLPRCLGAAAVWAVVAVVLALVTGVGAGWGLRAVAIAVPFLLTAGALTAPARRGRAGIGLLVLLAFPLFWVLYAVAVAVLG
ncbi:hypothetical protein [Pseudonocardia sp. KRD291]|uniref:hypothetical protein n=1 Tax=Pseudonocardia sp. KRD291 TaxID=2792007 RepID=UPI001C4A5528|nr:hypothetical protein [Pseudonocardia sp. KRD291]MBW0102666.1 hypothetical protein [Pseudonocardia sp. KRD291]